MEIYHLATQTLNISHNNVLVCSCFFLLTGYCRIKRFWNSSRTVVEQRKEFSLCFYIIIKNGTEQNGLENNNSAQPLRSIPFFLLMK
jgi:hypothetical protein